MKKKIPDDARLLEVIKQKISNRFEKYGTSDFAVDDAGILYLLDKGVKMIKMEIQMGVNI